VYSENLPASFDKKSSAALPTLRIMKILFDTDAIHYPLTGIGRYAYEIGKHLPDANGIEQLLYFRDGLMQTTMSIRPDTGGRAEKARVRLRRWAGSAPFISKAYRKLVAKQQEHTLHQLAAENFLFHGPNFSLPAYGGACVATFHDLSVLLWPECHPKEHVRFMTKEMQLAVKRAHVLLTHSEFSRQEIAAYFAFPLDHIIIAPLATSSAFRPMSEQETIPVLSRVGLEYGCYSLFFGTLDPRTNVNSLIDVYERLPHKLRQRIPLVVAGIAGWDSEKIIKRLKAAEQIGWARYLGFVDEAALPSLYAGARVFLYPSSYNGFALPVLEAMTSGIPLICSNVASAPEITDANGGAAALVPANDVNQLYGAVVLALNDDTWCKEMRARSIKRAGDFSWDKTVAATIAAYGLALQLKDAPT
jgi:alpha-1,3-rhamnosyl/mannosyltransferase